MRTDRVVVSSPAFRQDLCFLERVEQFAVQKLLPHLAVKRLGIAVLPWRPWFDREWRDVEMLQPVPELARDELRPIIRTDMRRKPATQEQISQDQEDVL